jgi:hypothetical protein
MWASRERRRLRWAEPIDATEFSVLKTLTDEHGDDARLKKGTHVEVTVSSEPKAVKHED